MGGINGQVSGRAGPKILGWVGLACRVGFRPDIGARTSGQARLGLEFGLGRGFVRSGQFRA
jgi:hypothetical protein